MLSRKPFVFAIVVPFFVLGCSPLWGARPAPDPTPIPELLELAQQFGEVQGDLLKEGVLAVTVNAPASEFAADILVQSEGGIIFSEGDLPTGQVNMLPFEYRQLLFPYKVDDKTALSGEYITFVRVITSEGMTEKRIKSFVLGQNLGSVHLFSSQQEFDSLLDGNFVLANTGLSVLIVLENIAQPTKGKLIVKVTSQADNYMPVIIVNVLGGIFFEQAQSVIPDTTRQTVFASAGKIAASGSRILVFPFRLDPNSNDGIYAFKFKLKVPGKEEILDYSPIALKVSSSLVKHTKWLSEQEISLPPPTAEDSG